MTTTQLIQEAYKIAENTVSAYSCAMMSDQGVAWVLSQLGKEHLLQGVLQDARRMAGDAIYSDQCAMNRYALEKALSEDLSETEGKPIDVTWVSAFTGLQVTDIKSFTISDGVLHVVPGKVIHVLDYKSDFIAWNSNGVLTFDLPLPERITPDGKSDYKDMCDTWAGDDHIVCWRERVECEKVQFRSEMHRRNLSAGGDL
jgi:hypothetical protein